MGEYNEADSAYDEILQRIPNYTPAIFGKASLLAINRDYEKALALIPKNEPRSRSDWVGSHISGMIALRQGRLDVAEAFFTAGYEKTPFSDQRNVFGNGIALVKIRRKEFREVPKLLRSATSSAASIFLIHSYFELGEWDKARAEYRHVNDNGLLPLVRQLRDGLASKYQLINFGKPPSDDWIAEKEAVLLLQAA